jgi:hypothetical protein
MMSATLLKLKEESGPEQHLGVRFKLLRKLERVVDSSNSRASCTLPKSGALTIKAIFG